LRLLTRRQAFGVAAVIAMIVAGLVYLVLTSKVEKPEEAAPQRVTVVVAAQEIDAFDTITSEMLASEEMDAKAAPAGSLSAPEQAIGKIANTRISEGDALTQNNVGPRTAERGLTLVIPEGLRAVTVALDPVTGVGGFVLPGDRVDVLATFQQGEVTVTNTILQNVLVLAMNAQTTPPSPKAAGEQQPEGEGAEVEGGEAPVTEQVASATLAVAPDQAQSLILAAYKGAVHLVLRRRKETAVVALESTTDWAMMGLQAPMPPEERPAREEEREPTVEERMAAMGYPGDLRSQGAWRQPPGAPEAVPEAEAKPAGPVVEVIRGTEREVVTAQ
jgi:pilus assembly protein CpaB